MLEFVVARPGRPAWDLYVQVGLPSPDDQSRRLGGGRALPRPEHPRPGSAIRSSAARALARAGIDGGRHRRLSLGGGLVIWGARLSADGAARVLRAAPGGWRDS